MRFGRLAFLGAVSAFAVHCGIDAGGENDAQNLGGNPGSADFGTGGFLGGSPGPQDPGVGGPMEPPPEVEVDLAFELPKAGQNYVYAANPASDSVAVINAATLGIETVEAGDAPTFLQTLGDSDAALVLNVGSGDATIVRTEDGRSRTSKVDVQDGSNAISVSPDARHAVVYYDASLVSEAAPPGSFQDVTVLFLGGDEDRAVDMTVGFRPMRVFFSSDGARGFVVTEDGVSVLDFEAIEDEGAGIARTVALGQTGVDRTLDVSVTPDGAYALARAEGESTLRLVDLETETVRVLDLSTLLAADPAPAPPADGGAAEPGSGDAGPAEPDAAVAAPSTTISDVDLSPDGSYALAVARDASAVLRVPVPEAFEDPGAVSVTRIENEFVGSVEFSPDARSAVLYTTAVQSVERITILDLEGDAPPRRVQLRKSVRAVTVFPDGEHAVIVHDKAPGDPNDPAADTDTRVDRSFGFSLVSLSTGFPKLQITPTEVGPFTSAAGFLFVLLRDAAIRRVQQVDLESFQTEAIDLGSPPVSVGAVPGSNRVFVGQEHPDGRITFIDWTTGDVRSVTGFELNSRIRE